MPQYFFDGWVNAYPGDGRMQFNMPPDSNQADITFCVHKADDVASIVITGHVEDIGQDGQSQFIAVIEWMNSTARSIPFDYDIAPYTVLELFEA